MKKDENHLKSVSLMKQLILREVLLYTKSCFAYNIF